MRTLVGGIDHNLSKLQVLVHQARAESHDTKSRISMCSLWRMSSQLLFGTRCFNQWMSTSGFSSVCIGHLVAMMYQFSSKPSQAWSCDIDTRVFRVDCRARFVRLSSSHDDRVCKFVQVGRRERRERTNFNVSPDKASKTLRDRVNTMVDIKISKQKFKQRLTFTWRKKAVLWTDPRIHVVCFFSATMYFCSLVLLNCA